MLTQLDVADGARNGVAASDDAATVQALQVAIKHLMKSVRFDDDAVEVHEIIPYGEIYGAHPRTFVFAGDSEMIPAARGGYVSASSMVETPEDSEGEEDEDKDATERGDWETWLRERESERHNVATIGEQPAVKAPVFSRCLQRRLPDLDEDDSWETWFDSTLLNIEEQNFIDPSC